MAERARGGEAGAPCTPDARGAAPAGSGHEVTPGDGVLRTSALTKRLRNNYVGSRLIKK